LATPLTEYQVRVLLIDDQQIVGETIRRQLAPEPGIVFHHCLDPKLAISTAVDFAPTVILQDLVMPDVDGMALVKFYRKHPKLRNIPLIVLSSREDPVTKAEAFSHGANDYIVKLPDRIELLARIHYHSRGYISLMQRNDAYEALLKSQRALASELEQAAAYVRSLIPAPIEEGAIRTCWRFVPTAQLGGDSFGYHWLDNRWFLFYLLDVCGHGVGSALLSASAINTLQNQTLPGVDFTKPEQVVTAMNETYPMARQNNLYFTLWYGVFDTQDRRLSFASGGAPPVFLLSANAAARPLESEGVVVGAFPGLRYENREVTLEPGSRVYLFSDGVYEVEPPEGPMWTLEQLGAWLTEHVSPDGSEIDRLYAHLQDMKQDQVLDDDFSVLRLDFD
jgi:sigma-B regulation protein RsbU (phosphoserine phosphatase)